jgi:RNA polymerase sigma factor (TIGR02999 family)
VNRDPGPRDRRDTTLLLLAVREGGEPARSALFDRLYGPLRELARRQLRRARGGALQTTELVHEAFLKLCDASALDARDRSHFLAVSARAMRQILVDHFRARSAQKRGGARVPVELSEGSIAIDDRGEVLLALDEALRRLTLVSGRAGRVVELKFFGGMTEPEIAEELEVSVRTVSSEWRRARAWLSRELQAV